MSQKLPDSVIKLLRRNGSAEPNIPTKEFGAGLKTSGCDDSAVRFNGLDGDFLINWGTHIPADSLNGFSNKDISFKWEPPVEEFKPIESRVFEVNTFYFIFIIQTINLRPFLHDKRRTHGPVHGRGWLESQLAQSGMGDLVNNIMATICSTKSNDELQTEVGS